MVKGLIFNPLLEAQSLGCKDSGHRFLDQFAIIIQVGDGRLEEVLVGLLHVFDITLKLFEEVFVLENKLLAYRFLWELRPNAQVSL